MDTSPPAATARLLYSHRFVEDFGRLEAEVAKRTAARLRLIEEHGVRHSGLETRRVRAQRDAGYHLIDVDDDNRMVVYLQGDGVLCERVGRHDPTERWAERATMRDYVERAKAAVRDFADLASWYEIRERRELDEEPVAELPEGLLEQLAATPAASDLVMAAPVDFLEGYRDGLIEDWMVFLSPLQRYIVERRADGPSRVSGGPGTGKTVVALHRAAHIAEDLGRGSLVLLTSYVRTLPPILRNLYERMSHSSDERGEVEFRHIVDIARSVVERHEGSAPRLDDAQARSRFAEVWRNVARMRQILEPRGVDEDYVWEEIRRVIRGRGIRDLSRYQSVKRVGRRRPLGTREREAVWHLSEAYDQSCQRAVPRLYDQDTLIERAARLLSDSKVGVEYDAVVIDEAQDLTSAALWMLVQLTAGGPKGRLLLAGDGGQRIYPGGFRLSELGVDVRGRAFILRQAYRSTTEILDAIARLGRLLSAEDFGEDGLGAIPVKAVRSGTPPTIRRFDSAREEIDRITQLLIDRGSDAVDATAVLVPSNREARDWRRHLKERGVRAVLLEEYDGTPTPGVKVGTYTRSKGLEFETVILPGLSADRFPTASLDDDEETFFQEGGWFYVAMGRARDQLFITFSGEPSMLIEEIVRRHDKVPEASIAASAGCNEHPTPRAGEPALAIRDPIPTVDDYDWRDDR
jgi:superfamily I DNA/RNA helicase